MSVRRRILLTLLVVFAAVQGMLGRSLVEDLRPRHLATMEETLVEVAHLVAHIAAEHWQQPDTLQQRFASGDQLKQAATIYAAVKEQTDLRVYLTDTTGTVIVDSHEQDIGADYSLWNNIIRCLRGEYGARATMTIPDNPASTHLHVSQPVIIDGAIVGVATVAKAQAGIAPFLGGETRGMLTAVILAMVALTIVAILITWWATYPIAKLQAYADAIGQRRVIDKPKLGPSDLAALADAFEAMRLRLEGRHYVANYTQALTHALKSPLTGLRGAAELLATDITPEQRQRFLDNISVETERMQSSIDGLLQLAELEELDQPPEKQQLALHELIKNATAEWQQRAAQRGIRLDSELAEYQIVGDQSLIRLAIDNLLANGIDFANAAVTVTLNSTGMLTITDDGPGIPDYALPRVFERFYSLPRPKSGAKGSGLGLVLVKEIIHLHEAAIKVDSSDQGTTFAITWQAAAPNRRRSAHG